LIYFKQFILANFCHHIFKRWCA